MSHSTDRDLIPSTRVRRELRYAYVALGLAVLLVAGVVWYILATRQHPRQTVVIVPRPTTSTSAHASPSASPHGRKSAGSVSNGNGALPGGTTGRAAAAPGASSTLAAEPDHPAPSTRRKASRPAQARASSPVSRPRPAPSTVTRTATRTATPRPPATSSTPAPLLNVGGVTCGLLGVLCP